MEMTKKHLPHYTYSDYEHWEGRWELIFGIPYAMTPSPTPRHQHLNALLTSAFIEAMRTCNSCLLMTQVDWKLSEETVVCPDISISCQNIGKKYLTGPPEIVIEIFSPSTRHKDKTLKYEIYQEQGVSLK